MENYFHLSFFVIIDNVGGIMLEEVKEKITNDSEYLTWMRKISEIEKEFASSSSFNNQVALDHGKDHMDRVAHTTYTLLKEYGTDERTAFLGYVSGLVHDIGMIYGKKKHAENGSKLAFEFLQRLAFLADEEVESICSAISTHGSGENATSILGSFLAISDKIDLCEKRTLGSISPIKFIRDYEVHIQNKTLKISYEFSAKDGKNGLYMIPKSIDVPLSIGTSLGLKVEFYINGKLDNFEDRNSYQGDIYYRK